MVEYRKVMYEECINCHVQGLCKLADAHRKKEGYSNIHPGSEECKECKERLPKEDAPPVESKGDGHRDYGDEDSEGGE